MTGAELYQQQLDIIAAEFPKVKVVTFESSWLMRNTFQKIARNIVGLTLYNRVYIAQKLVGTESGAETLYHEAVHLRQEHKLTILFFLLYFVLPIGPGFRAIWEWEAYKASMRWTREHPYPDQNYQEYIEDYTAHWVSNQFCNLSYLFMFPFKDYMYRKSKEYFASLGR